MPRRKKAQVDVREGQPQVTVLSPRYWLKAVYHCHVFHYRMPETVAIAAVNPFVPSPLTVKMALIAALLQKGDDQSAQQLANYLPQMEVRIVPPKSAFSFKAFLRYHSVPAVESAGGLDESGSYYPSRPHTREFALLEDSITIFLGLPDKSIVDIARNALANIRYLGCKDSLVTCWEVQKVDESELRNAKTAQRLSTDIGGPVILAADFESSAKVELQDLIPGSRKEEHYRRPPYVYVLPGQIIVKGRTRIFWLQGGDGK
ncbi:MAG: hypothetical protein C4295_11855 [Candidatus Fervidibacterota bacterium]